MLLQELLEHFRERELGGRVFSCTTGSAPSAAEVLRWLDDVMGFPALNGYGSTECGVTILNNKVVSKWVPPPPSFGCMHNRSVRPRPTIRVVSKWVPLPLPLGACTIAL